MMQVIYFLGYILYILQQPPGWVGYVSPAPQTVTQFRMVSQYGNIGLLAHNYEAGQFFSLLDYGDTIMVYNDSDAAYIYRVTDIERYYAFEPLNPYGSFKDIETQTIYTAQDLFSRVYADGDNRLILQTCFDGTNGRLFIMADRIKVINTSERMR